MNEEYNVAFNGVVDGLPDISIDNFQDKTKKAYFLSHLHTDHMSGLLRGNDFQKEFDGNAKIYMTSVTRKIFSIKYDWQFNRIQSKVVVLEPGSHSIMINREEVQLTLIPVVHMPGAVMFLFKTSGGKVILFTGDFVMNDAQLNEFKQSNWLRGDDGERIGVDLLYFDETYRHLERFRYNRIVPDRSRCIERAANAIREWLDGDASNAVAISTYYDFGYEDLFKGIYDQLGGRERIWLTNGQQRTVYSQILDEYQRVYTDSSSRIHVCQMSSHCALGCSRAHYKKFIVYAFPGDEPIMAPDHREPNAWRLCFPTHCSDSQLDNFINYISPLDRVPFSLGN